jgi:hypothetical protein
MTVREAERPLLTAAGRRLQGPLAFATVAAGQVASLLGSELTAFVLGVWVFQQTGSATAFALLAFSTSLPSILVTPLAGVLVDRWPRKRALVVADTGAALGTALLLMLALASRLTLPWIYTAIALAALFQAFHFPAFQATVPLLVPKRHLTRANGFLELGSSGATLLAPLLAGALLVPLGLAGVLAVDLATFVIAVTAVIAVSIPSGRPATAAPAGDSLWREARHGLKYIWERPALVALLLLLAGINFSLGFVHVLLPPLVLSFASPAALGVVMSLGAAGVLLGGALVTITGGPRRGRMRWILGGLAVQGAILFLGGLQPSVPLVAAAAFTYSLCGPLVLANYQSLWQLKVAPELYGRVFAMRRVVALALTPLAFLVAGPLADRVFEPWLAEGGLLAGSVGRLIGVGSGRGIGLLFIVLGVVLLSLLGIAVSYRPLRRLEQELPDALPDTAAGVPAAETTTEEETTA